jgi:hypothetical protein
VALTGPPLALQSGSHSSLKFRQMLSALLQTEGVCGLTDCLVKQRVVASQGVLVSAGALFMPGTSSSVQGAYFDYNDADSSIDFPAADGSLTRIDRLIYRVRDPDYVTGSPPGAFEPVQGTAGSGTPPAIPADSVSLAKLTRPSSGGGGNTITNAMITDERPFAIAVGGMPRQWANTGAPTSGTYITGQTGFDSNGTQWLCTSGGTPGTWIAVGGWRLWSSTSPSNGASSVDITIPAGFKHFEFWARLKDRSGNLYSFSQVYMQIGIAGSGILNSANDGYAYGGLYNAAGDWYGRANGGTSSAGWYVAESFGGGAYNDIGSARIWVPFYTKADGWPGVHWHAGINDVSAFTQVFHGHGYYYGSHGPGAVTSVRFWTPASGGFDSKTTFDLFMHP